MTRRLVAFLLGLAPPDFRERVGAELLAVHAERSARVHGVPRRAWFAAREVFGAALLVARLRLGMQPASRYETTTRGGGATMFETTLQDARFAARTLRRNPGFLLAAVAVVALGIGANTAIFSAVNAFFFRPLPFQHADRLVTIYETNPEFAWTDAHAAPANLLDWRERIDAFDDVTGYAEFADRLTALRDGEPVVVIGASVVGNFFTTLGVAPALGRTLDFEETWEGSDGVVVLSHDLWMSYFGGDPDIVGKTMEFTFGSPEIVGVMPENFRFPGRTQVWYTYGWTTDAPTQTWFRRAHFVRAVGRLAPGASVVDASEQLDATMAALAVEYPETNRVMGAGLMPMRDFLTRSVQRPLAILLGAVALLLLLACLNVANLMLVRANDRTREVALRHALGAGRARVARQMLTESLMIALAGAAVGLGLGWLGVRALGASQPIGIDGATELALDHRVVLFTVAAAVLSGLLFGLAPTLRTLSGRVGDAMREGSRGASTGRGAVRTVNALVTLEVGLALLLVVGAGLMVRTFWLLRDVDPGFTTRDVMAVQFGIPSARYQSRDEVLAFQDRFAELMEARPGVERVGSVGQLPLAGASWSSQFQAEGWPPERVGFEIVHRRADRGYFEALDIPLVRGRMYGPNDGPDAPRVLLVNETFAREHFPNEDPIGQRIAFTRAATPESTWWEIIGIVGDQHQERVSEPPQAEVFESRYQDWSRSPWVVIRGSADVAALAATARSVLGELDPLIAITQTRPLREVWRESMAREEFVLTLLTAFGLAALLLASVGVYGVTAQAARRRTREIGIRMALGAGSPDVLRLMLGHGVVVVGLGLALGMGGSLVATRALASMLYGVAPNDPATLAAVVALLGGVALLACYLPARRATGVDPVTSLRAE